MSSAVWPPLPPDQLIQEEEKTLALELEWLLNTLQDTLGSLKSGLEECVTLLAPAEPGATLALSSVRSESVKGVVVRVGTRIVKGDIHLRLPTLPPPRGHPSYALHLTTPLPPLPQLSALITLLNQSLDIIDISAWTGDPHNGSFIAGQLRLLAESVEDARRVLRGGEEVVGGRWWEEVGGEMNFSPPLPPHLSAHLSIQDAALVLHIRTLASVSSPTTANQNAPSRPTTPTPTPIPTPAPVLTTTTTSTFSALSLSGFALRQRLGLAPRSPPHDESERVFPWRGGGEEVRVREKVRVESQDPSLIAVMAKLSAVGHGVAVWRRSLGVVMGEEDEDEDGEGG